MLRYNKLEFNGNHRRSGIRSSGIADHTRSAESGPGRVLMDFVGMQVSVDDRPHGEEAGQKTRAQQAHPQLSS